MDDAYHLGEKHGGKAEGKHEQAEVAEDGGETGEIEVLGVEVNTLGAEAITRMRGRANPYKNTKAILIINIKRPQEETNTMMLG